MKSIWKNNMFSGIKIEIFLKLETKIKMFFLDKFRKI